MYVIEWIIKKIIQKIEKTNLPTEPEVQNQDYEACEHVFMPVDSTGETLSCTKCGIVVRRKDLK